MGVDEAGPTTSGAEVLWFRAFAVLLGLVPVPLLAVVTLIGLAGGLQWPGQPPRGPLPFTWPVGALFLLNLAAAFVFGVKPRAQGWWLLIVVQVADVLAVAVMCAWEVSQGPPVDLSMLWPFIATGVASLGAVGVLLVLKKRHA